MASLLLEPCPISDIYADGIGRVENLGNCLRLVFFTWSEGERVVVAKLIRPVSSMMSGTSLIRMATAQPVLGDVVRVGH